MASYAELKARAEKYAAEAEAARLKEVGAIIEDMKAKMTEYNITAEDLGIRTSGYAPARKASSKAASTPAEAKYRSPTGETWSGGRGRKPKWVTELVEAGKDIEKYRINPEK